MQKTAWNLNGFGWVSLIQHARERNNTFAHHDDVEKVIVRQSVKDLLDRRLGDLDPQALHAAAYVQQDDHVFGTRSRSYIPTRHKHLMWLDQVSNQAKIVR